MDESIRYPIIRHLEDEDDLFQKRDGNLVAGQEAKAQDIANEIYRTALEKEKQVLVFFTSPKKRAIQTAEMVSNDIREKGTRIKIIQRAEEGIRDQYQGEVLLPEGYQVGDRLEGLALANKIFQAETFNENPEKDNLSYAFGDPVLLEDGSYKYEELRKYFSSPGESYRDVLVRLFDSLLIFSRNVRRLEERTLPVVFTHSQVFQIFKDLEAVARKYLTNELEYKPGTIARLCWDAYRERKAIHPLSPTIDFVAIDSLLEKPILKILEQETSYLRSL